jgi:hypothetical protein
MAALSEQKLALVRTLVETAPDKVLDALGASLASASGETALAKVRRIVENEARDRRLRNLVLLPIVPLCSPGRGAERLSFPGPTLGLIWLGLKAQAPELVGRAAAAVDEYLPALRANEHFDRLAAVAAEGVRTRQPAEFAAVAECCDEARPGGGDMLAACLDLAPIVRSAAGKLGDWSGQPPDETVHALRIPYNDAVAIAPEAAPRFFKMLAAQLPHEWMILRIVSAIMGNPTERLLAESELGIFAEQVLQHTASAIDSIHNLDLDGGAAAASSAAELIQTVSTEASELEASVSLSREQGWGRTLLKHRKGMADAVEGRFRECERSFNQALPCARPGWKSIRRGSPRLDVAPDETAIRRCETLLAFAREVRHSASHGGFASARTKLLETLAEQLDIYIEEMLELVKSGQSENPEFARGFLGAAARFVRLIEDDKAASLIKRRIAAAFAAAGEAPKTRLATGT